MTDFSNRRAALVVASAGYFFVLLDVTIVNVALAHIGSDLGGSRASLQWVVDAYALVLAAFMLSSGDLADRFGAPRVFAMGLALFGLASAGCAAAPSIGFLIGARALQGLGAAAILPTSLAIVNQLFTDPSERPRAIGTWAALGGSAMVAGPVLGGVLVAAVSWRAIFWLNVPLAALASALAVALIPAQSPRKARRLDLGGQISGALALLGLVSFLIESGREGFEAPVALVAAVLGLTSAVSFVCCERSRRQPLLELSWFAKPELSAANAASGLMNMGTLGALFAIGLYLQQSRGLSALDAGLTLVALAAPLAFLTPFSGRLVAASGPRRPAGIGLMICGGAYLGLAGVGASITAPGGIALLALAGTGMGIAVPGLVAGATQALGEGRAGIAAAINNTARQVGGAVGVALIGGLGSFSTALVASGAALLLGGSAALALMGRSRCETVRPCDRGDHGGRASDEGRRWLGRE
ncbi:MAG TPA: MFS transporter [Solirubrobacteraceae bacterium]|jgi:DHA2 family methylenomycin A resistance protein-like MFS transporter|nr:MFS transporter [Solirubrobacteraceae bacterium]